MIIRSQQIQQLRQNRDREFESFLILFLRSEFPEECASVQDSELTTRIEYHAKQARVLAIQDQNSLTKFIYLKWLFGEDFEDLPDPSWLIGLLHDRTRPSSERLSVALEGIESQIEHGTIFSIS